MPEHKRSRDESGPAASPDVEILAPAGSMESLVAAVRSGADAVYLGGKSLNARRGAANFDEAQLADAVSFCHIRGVHVYLTLNTVVFTSELRELELAIESACAVGVDGLIVQDLAVARMALQCAPSLPLHASTQMSVHNLDGVKMLEELGFTRCVLARELTRDEIASIAEKTPLEMECFVHGALCMGVSGQCYLSAMIGGRSGNRGLCAQPCRLPFDSGGSAHALSLRDLSLVEEIAGLSKAGVRSLKIEGRLKRPEYVAAAVHACVQSRAGERPDMDALRAVFSRGGFTKGYYMGRRGDAMFGTRQKEDVTAARPVLKELTRLYDRERQSVPVDFSLEIKAASPVRLEATDGFYKAAEAGAVPETARSAPITPERARALLEKTGGTPFKVRAVDCAIEEGLAFPASGLNALRRETLGTLTRERGRARPHTFKKMENMPGKDARLDKDPAVRVRVQSAAQLSPEMVRSASAVIVPVFELDRIGADLKTEMLPKLFVELPRVFFGFSEPLDAALKAAAAFGVTHAVAGNPGAVHRARAHGLNVHGDFGLNIANTLSLEALQGMGLIDATLSFELGLGQAKNTGGAIPTGIIAYGYIPLMIFRNNPAGTEGRAQGALTDRLGNKFRYGNIGDCTELYNMTPLYLADKKDDLRGFDFITLYFTHESADQCRGIMAAYRDGRASDQPKTRGLYYRKVL